jgi:hypothetical protein
MTYHAGGDVLVRAPGGDAGRAEAFERDLRWRATRPLRTGDHGLVAITEEEAVRIVDDRLARATHGEG